eukprot:GEMP01052842.1.p1 GENE.GEMP01052842.1~~GEMP01052842.1.p1  ORF type:complete len:228 (-),score=55.04 GEMP01052842.1:792-1475(-)
MSKKSGYKPSALPPILDLSNKNTRSQLVTGRPSDPKKLSQEACRDVMQEHLLEWIEKKDADHLIDARTSVGDVTAFWLWLRDFHKEYNDNWYTRNMPRLKEQFQPTFVSTLKERRQQTTETHSPMCDDLLDLGEPSTAPTIPSPANTQTSSGNLLDLLHDAPDAPTSSSLVLAPHSSTTATAPTAAPAHAPALPPTAISASRATGTDLLDLSPVVATRDTSASLLDL